MPEAFMLSPKQHFENPLILSSQLTLNRRNHFECLASVTSLFQPLRSALKDKRTNADQHSQAVSLTKDPQLVISIVFPTCSISLLKKLFLKVLAGFVILFSRMVLIYHSTHNDFQVSSSNMKLQRQFSRISCRHISKWINKSFADPAVAGLIIPEE